MEFSRRERAVLSTALTNYKRLWDDSIKQPDDIPYVDANIVEFETILQKIKNGNIP